MRNDSPGHGWKRYNTAEERLKAGDRYPVRLREQPLDLGPR